MIINLDFEKYDERVEKQEFFEAVGSLEKDRKVLQQSRNINNGV